MNETSDVLKKTLEREYIYSTAPRCPLCGGTMLPLKYLADEQGPWTSAVYMGPDDIRGYLKACHQCGSVRFFYPDKES